MMELTVQVDELTAETKWIGRLRDPGYMQESTRYIEVSTIVGALCLRRTNGEQFRQAMVLGAGGGQDEIVVDVSKFAALVGNLEPGEAILKIDGNELSVQSRRRTVRLKGEQYDFPIWPVFQSDQEEPDIVGQSEIRAVLASASTDPTIPALANIRFEGGNMVTTDRFRLSRVTYGSGNIDTVLPSEAAQAFTQDGIVYVDTGIASPTRTPMVRMERGGRILMATKPDIQFPEWKKLINDEQQCQIIVNAKDVIDAVRGKLVTLTVQGKKLTVLSKDTREDGVEVESTVDIIDTLVPYKGKVEVPLEASYLLDAMRAIGGTVIYTMAGANKAVTFTDLSGNNLHLIMPKKFKTERKAAAK